MNDKIFEAKNLYQLIDFEPFVILTCLLALAWGFYKFFLKGVSEERHSNLSRHYRNLMRHYFVLCSFFGTFLVFQEYLSGTSLGRAIPYLALACLGWGILIFVKTSRLIILQYLFLGSMQHGVPVLIVNIYSLILTVLLVLWGASHIFNLQLAPLIATSAVFSIILGLALQDTLGNLFAGISLQFDKSFEIGDWIEVTVSGGQKAVGQVKEISWRATVLIGWSDEVITLPNRTLANSQIANFSSGGHPIVRSQTFRLAFGLDTNKVKSILIDSIRGIPNVRQIPNPGVLISENTESWISYKLYYFIDNYGSQFGIADQVTDSAIRALAAHGISTAGQRVFIHNQV